MVVARVFSATVVLLGLVDLTLADKDLAVDADVSFDDSLCSVNLIQAKVSHGVQPSSRGVAKAPLWPFKGGNLNHSGYSAFTGPHDLSTPTWIFREPDRYSKGKTVPFMKVFHGSPIIDGDLNTYIQSTTGWVYSIDPKGSLRWSFETSSANPGNVALGDGAVYVCSQDGVMWAIDAATGNERWHSQIAKGCPDDTHSATVSHGLVLTACNVKHRTEGRTTTGNDEVCAVDMTNGKVKWVYDMVARSGNMSYNQMHSVVGDTVFFGDTTGGVYRVSIKDGSEIGYTPGITTTPPSFSTGGLVVGPNGQIFSGFNTGIGCNGPQSVGTVRSLDLEGNVLWTKQFEEGVNAAPAVGPLGPDGRLAVLVAVGHNFECMPVMPWVPKVQSHGSILALDAATGNVIWKFEAPPWGPTVAGSYFEDVCCPDVWGNPALAADGTAYLNWSGGWAMALRDVDGDGTVDPQDPKEYSAYHHGFGSNGNTAIVPGLTVMPSCKAILGYVTK